MLKYVTKFRAFQFTDIKKYNFTTLADEHFEFYWFFFYYKNIYNTEGKVSV